MNSKNNGIINGLQDLSRLSGALSRSISPENITGTSGNGGRCSIEKGSAGNAARDLGIGWKVNPFIVIPGGKTVDLADIEGEGCIQHIWMTPTGKWRNAILRFYWDDSPEPSVECPVGDFFGCGYNEYSQISSLAVCVNPGSAFNCYWQMPFRRHCRITLENRADEDVMYYYQIDYTLTEIPTDCAYFHAQFRRVNPLPYKDVYTIADNIVGQGHYVGTYLAWGVNNNGWWGEGEIKFFMDEDTEYPTICGTGVEDYFGGSYNFENPATHKDYVAYSTPYSGLHQVLIPDRMYRSQFRFGMYRWHIVDPVRFSGSLKVTIQALGWRDGGRYLPRQDDIASVAFWYQTLPGARFPELPDRDYLEII
ncbi:MAG: glycoside hydrolase family 172 protein [Saccharofermentanales bacterium]